MSKPTEAQVLGLVVDRLRKVLPPGWSFAPGTTRHETRTEDASYSIVAPDGRQTQVLVEVKAAIPSGRHALDAAHSLHHRAGAVGAVPMIASRYIAPPTREALQRAGVSYADATGNIMFSAIDPGVYLFDRGEDRDPWRAAGRPRGTLKGDPAARVVRALLDFARAWRVRELITETGASTGATYRVLEYLDDERLIERNADGSWSVPAWEPLLRAWARDYNFLMENAVSRFIDPRGVTHFQSTLAGTSEGYAVTGAAASHDWAAVAPLRSVFVYVDDTVRRSREWGLHPTEVGVNVVLIEPRKPASVYMDRATRTASGVLGVSAAQAAVDLLNGPGRDPAEAEALISWMTKDERRWRLP